MQRIDNEGSHGGIFAGKLRLCRRHWSQIDDEDGYAGRIAVDVIDVLLFDSPARRHKLLLLIVGRRESRHLEIIVVP